MKSFKEFIKESTVPYNVWGPKKYEGAYGKGSFDRKLFDEIKKVTILNGLE